MQRAAPNFSQPAFATENLRPTSSGNSVPQSLEVLPCAIFGQVSNPDPQLVAPLPWHPLKLGQRLVYIDCRMLHVVRYATAKVMMPSCFISGSILRCHKHDGHHKTLICRIKNKREKTSTSVHWLHLLLLGNASPSRPVVYLELLGGQGLPRIRGPRRRPQPPLPKPFGNHIGGAQPHPQPLPLPVIWISIKANAGHPG